MVEQPNLTTTAFTDIFYAINHFPRTQPNAPVYSYANEAGDITQEISWQALGELTDNMTGFLRGACHLQEGDRVLLVYPPSLDFVIAFTSCLRAGLIPVPVFPPNPRKFDNGMEAFLSIAHDCDAKLALTNQHYERSRRRGKMATFIQENTHRWNHHFRWIVSDTIPFGHYPPVYATPKQDHDIALIQYTSGSTSLPKGVAITFRNLAHQLNYTTRVLEVKPDSCGVFWVPQYHDLGLIGGIMNAFVGNSHSILFSPIAFIKRPGLWFDVIHKTRATLTAAPNFAFDLALEKTTESQRAQWDLRCLEVVMNAAEPIRANTIARFCQAFSVSGFAPTAMSPAYGLAEHTVGISFNGGALCRIDKTAYHQQRIVPVSPAHQDAVELVSSGTFQQDVVVKIVNPETLIPCDENTIGEIWVDSPSKAAGYWDKSSGTAIAFNGVLRGADSPLYLRTGDLGFILHNELYVCGRVKDMLIVSGRNIYPQDIEETVASIHATPSAQTFHPAEASTENRTTNPWEIRPLAIAAFSVDVTHAERTEEKLVIIVEIKQRRLPPSLLQQFASTILKTVLNKHQLTCHDIVITPLGGVLKTTSGKVRRRACRQQWLSGAMHDSALYVLSANTHNIEVKNTGEPPIIMASIAAQLMNLPTPRDIDPAVSLFDQGMGSLVAVEFCQRYEEATQQELSITDMVNYPTIQSLCQYLACQQRALLSLDDHVAQHPSLLFTELQGLRHSLKHNHRNTIHHSDKSPFGFCIEHWCVRPATIHDTVDVYRLDQQEYGWLGEDATDDESVIRHQIMTLNSGETPWFWLLEHHGHVVGWYILQPTLMQPGEITSWAQATNHGTLTGTFNPNGHNLYLVAGGVCRHHSKHAHRLMVANTVSLMAAHRMTTVTACLAMPGFIDAHHTLGIAPDAYVALTRSNGSPKDPFLAFFAELWPGVHHPMRLLRNGYPPDVRSGGHGVCVCVDTQDYAHVIDRIFDQIAQQTSALFGVTSPPLATSINSKEISL